MIFLELLSLRTDCLYFCRVVEGAVLNHELILMSRTDGCSLHSVAFMWTNYGDDTLHDTNKKRKRERDFFHQHFVCI